MAYRSDANVPFPVHDITEADAHGNFGIDGPNVPAVEWYPRGDGAGQPAPNRFLKSGQPPKRVGSIALKSVDFVQVAFMCPPSGDDSEKYINEGMLAFVIKERDVVTATQTIMTLANVNQTMCDSHREFRTYRDEANPQHDIDCVIFWEYLQEFGEQMLEIMHQARKNTVLYERMREDMTKHNPEKWDKLEHYYAMSTQDLFCWQTAFGIKQKIEFLGSVIGMGGRTDPDDTVENNDHFTVVNIALAKRARVANVFGPSTKITTGSKLWLTLRRRQVIEADGIAYNEFQIVPGGSMTEAYPLQRESSYIDPSGRPMSVWRWHVGVVNFPGSFSPTIESITMAANTGSGCSLVRSFNEHAGLPMMYISLGVKQ